MKTPDGKRTERIGELIKQELAQMLVDELKDPRIGFTTVTEVRVTGDLRTARVYVSVYGTAAQRAESLAGLSAAAGFVKRELGSRLRLRYTPDVVFCHDDTLDQAFRMEELMAAIAAGKTEAPKPGVTEALPVDTDRSELAVRAREFEAAATPKKPEGRRRRGRRGRR